MHAGGAEIEAFNATVDFVVSGVLGQTFRRLGTTVTGLRDRKHKEDFDIFEWFDTELLVDRVGRTRRLADQVPGLSELDEAAAKKLDAAMRGAEAQAALQRMLAAKIIDAPEPTGFLTFGDALRAAGAEVAGLTDALATCLDSELDRIVAALKKKKPDLLKQIRDTAIAWQTLDMLRTLSYRIVGLGAPPSREITGEFLAKYRKKVSQEFGWITIPNVRSPHGSAPLDQIYVPTPLSEGGDPMDPRGWPDPAPDLDLPKIGRLRHRSVLLGDPGGGKTTGTRLLMHYFVTRPSDDPDSGRVPFLVELRQYAANDDPPSRNIVRHIENRLRYHFQADPPPRLIERLLLTGQANVIFDGLDELPDLSLRQEVASEIDHFCTEYPQARVLVTARANSYGQARLYDPEFVCYRLGSWSVPQIGEYVRKRFELAGDVRALTFLRESESFTDLRSNPLLLSMMCFHYLDRGSLPPSRAELYENCARMLTLGWDERRNIQSGLSPAVRNKIEQTLSYLAWRIYNNSWREHAISESLLISETANYLRDHGFRESEAAKEAAEELAAFSRDRAWIFIQVDRNSRGERMYGFRHTAFLEYFAANYLAGSRHEAAELAVFLADRIPDRDDWWPVGDLAISINNKNPYGNFANDTYDHMIRLSADQPPERAGAILRFLMFCLPSAADDVEDQLPELARRFFAAGISGQRIQGTTPEWMRALGQLLMYGSEVIVAGALREVIGTQIREGNPPTRTNSLWLTASLRNSSVVPQDVASVDWVAVADNIVWEHADAVMGAAVDVPYLRHIALELGIMPARQALEMPGGFAELLRVPASYFPQDREVEPYLHKVCAALRIDWYDYSDPLTIATLESIGEYLTAHPAPPWLTGEIDLPLDKDVSLGMAVGNKLDRISATAYLGAAVLLAILAERTANQEPRVDFAPLRGIIPYLSERLNPGTGSELPGLHVPGEFGRMFRDWALGSVDFAQGKGA